MEEFLILNNLVQKLYSLLNRKDRQVKCNFISGIRGGRVTRAITSGAD